MINLKHDTNSSAQLKFSIEHYITRTCQNGHKGGFRATAPIVSLTPHPRDIIRAGDAAATDNVDIGCYLSHLLARRIEPSGQTGVKLFDLEDSACLHHDCNATSRVCAVQTAWPQVLHIVPETSGDTADAFERRLHPDCHPHPVHYPLRFSINTQSQSASLDQEPVPGELKIDTAVEYKLIGRLLFDSERAHFTAELLIDDRMYRYDDRDREGVLSEVGPATMLEDLSPTVSLVLYHRCQEGNITEHDHLYYDSTPKERWHPRRLSSMSVDSKNSSLRLKSQSLVDRDSDSGTHDSTTARRPSGSNERKTDISGGPTETRVAVKCVGCDDDEEHDMMIQCDDCLMWSHLACIDEHFDVPSTYANPEERWSCPRCTKGMLVWTDSL